MDEIYRYTDSKGDALIIGMLNGRPAIQAGRSMIYLPDTPTELARLEKMIRAVRLVLEINTVLGIDVDMAGALQAAATGKGALK